MLRPAGLLVALAVLAVAVAGPPASTPAAVTALDSCALPRGPLPTQTRAVFVLDTSGSMRGAGDGKANIFAAVKASMNAYVRQTRPDRLELLTFDGGLRSRRGFDHPAGTPGWNAALGALKAEGQNTHLYRSLRDALSPLQGADTYLTTVFVLTDGRDNDRQRPVSAPQALGAFAGRGPLDRLYYLALGTDIPPAAQAALHASAYASGQTVPVGQVPDLSRLGAGGGLQTVNDPEQVRAAFPEGTPVRLAAADGRVRLAAPQVSGGRVPLAVQGAVPYGSPALLCAPPEAQGAGQVAPRPRRVLLRLTLDGAAPLVWLNPGADRQLQRGEAVVLRYRAARAADLRSLALADLGAGLRGEVLRQPGAQEFAVRLTNVGLTSAQVAAPSLRLTAGPRFPLPAVTGGAGNAGAVAAPTSRPSTSVQAPVQASGRTPDQTPGQTPDQTSLVGRTRFPRRLAWLLLGLLGALLAALLLRWASRRWRAGRSNRALVLPQDSGVPEVRGLQYGEDRTLSLVTPQGDVIGVPTPLGGPFDLGQVARTPLLSGVRAEQHRDGLRVLRVPGDLELSQGTRDLRGGDIVRPGTLLGVNVAKPDRAPHLSLGSLGGLGLPLQLRCDDLNLRAVGPFGDHVLHLGAGLTDLGGALEAPALRGLKVSTSNLKVLLVELPRGLSLRRLGESAPLRPGTYLPEVTLLDFPEP